MSDQADTDLSDSEDQFDSGFELLPADDEVTVDERLEAALAGVTPDEADDVDTAFGRGWAFDYASGEFVPHGLAPARVTGLTQLQAWIEKAVRTARGAHPIYSDDFGVDDAALYAPYGYTFSAGIAQRWADGLRDALVVHDRISDVTDFQFTGDPADTTMFVTFTVTTDEGEDLTVTQIPLGGA
jgi:hypothetical protein